MSSALPLESGPLNKDLLPRPRPLNRIWTELTDIGIQYIVIPVIVAQLCDLMKYNT